MPEDQKAGRARTPASAIIIGAAVVLAILLAVYEVGWGSAFHSRKLTVTTYFTKSAGLKAGAAVNLNGVTVGTVKSVTISLAPDRKKTPVQVTMALDGRYRPNLTTNSTATITSMGAMGDTMIDINSRDSAGTPLRDGDNLNSIPNPGVLDAKVAQETIASVNAMVGRLNTVVDQVEKGKGTIGLMMSDPDLQNNGRGTVVKVKQLTAKLNSKTNTMGRLVNDHSVTDKLSAIATDMQGVNALLGKVPVGTLQANLAVTQAHASSLMADVNAGKGGAGMLMKDSAARKDLSGAMEKANGLVAGMDAGKGTLGKLGAGGAASVDFGKLAAESSALATMIRQNPKKYLTIEVRIF